MSFSEFRRRREEKIGTIQSGGHPVKRSPLDSGISNQPQVITEFILPSLRPQALGESDRNESAVKSRKQGGSNFELYAEEANGEDLLIRTPSEGIRISCNTSVKPECPGSYGLQETADECT